MKELIPVKKLNPVKTGELELIVICIIAIIPSVIIIGFYNYYIGQDRLVNQLFRLLLSLILMGSTIAGNRTAKWILLFTFVYSVLEFIKKALSTPFGSGYDWAMLLVACYNAFFVI